MCFGSPSAPTITYSGPSAEDVAASNAALDAFKTETAANNAAFQTSINNQISDAQAGTQALLDQLTDIQANAGSVNNIVDDAPYAVTTDTNVTPDDAQTTAEVSKKKNKPSTLKISSGGLQASGGTGVNYGV
tara:strand:+ start:368 stop:763 length:396 start_codon:yes stop_codon:yes gene_type:complete